MARLIRPLSSNAGRLLSIWPTPDWEPTVALMPVPATAAPAPPGPPAAMLPVRFWKTVTPLLLVMLKFRPMLRAAARLTSATVTRSITCCSPGMRIRLMTFGPPASRKSRRPGSPPGALRAPGTMLTLRLSTGMRDGCCSGGALARTMRRMAVASAMSLAWPLTASLSPISDSLMTLSGKFSLISSARAL